MQLDKVIDGRCSVRKFKEKKPKWRDIIKAVDAGRKAPLAGNIPTLKFIIVSEPILIAKLAEASQQNFIANAPYVVVVCSDILNTIRSYDERGRRYAYQQAGAAIENFLLKITELGLSTCWVGAFVDEHVKQTLKIPELVQVEALFPIGYAMRREKQKIKPGLDRVLRFNYWKQKTMVPEKRVEGY